MFQNVSLKSLNRKQNALKLETTCLFSSIFVEGNNAGLGICFMKKLDNNVLCCA